MPDAAQLITQIEAHKDQLAELAGDAEKHTADLERLRGDTSAEPMKQAAKIEKSQQQVARAQEAGLLVQKRLDTLLIELDGQRQALQADYENARSHATAKRVAVASAFVRSPEFRDAVLTIHAAVKLENIARQGLDFSTTTASVNGILSEASEPSREDIADFLQQSGLTVADPKTPETLAAAQRYRLTPAPASEARW